MPNSSKHVISVFKTPINHMLVLVKMQNELCKFNPCLYREWEKVDKVSYFHYRQINIMFKTLITMFSYKTPHYCCRS